MINNRNFSQIILLILDGWGIAPSWGGNAISVANVPVFEQVWKNYPHTTLCASGDCVGLPGHERGNSEVGHLNLGTGRIVKQDSSKIFDAIKNGSFYNNPVLIGAIEHARNMNSNLHLMGLVSDGGIHSHIDHLYAIIDLCKKMNFDHNHVFIHAFTDGRDDEPMSALTTLSHLQEKLKKIGIGQIATISGRYYGMDRDNHWERTSRVYNAMAKGEGGLNESVLATISSSYNQGITDEFIVPTVITESGKPVAKVKDNDSVIFFNFRSDRARQIAMSFLSDNMKNFPRGEKINNLYFVGMIPYGYEKELRLDLKSAFPQEELIQPMAETLSKNNFKQFHSAETEKYAHVTYFFNGGVENPFPGESRFLVPSPRVTTYDLKPEMSLREVNANAIKVIKSKKNDFVLVNFANPDMVGHTGNFKAALSACEIVDAELGNIIKAAFDSKAIMMITADHGNIEQMVNPLSGEPDTEHTRNPVPYIIVGDKNTTTKDLNVRSGGILADIAPSILELYNIPQPSEFSGKTLITRV